MMDVQQLLDAAVERLRSLNVADEALARMTVRRGPFAPKLVRTGRAWRLGVLLLGTDGSLYATGKVTRAIEPLRAVTNRSAEAEARRDDRRAAVRGRFPEGEVVNYGFGPIDLAKLPESGGPVVMRDGVAHVVWNTGGGTRPLAGYLDERIGILDEP